MGVEAGELLAGEMLLAGDVAGSVVEAGEEDASEEEDVSDNMIRSISGIGLVATLLSLLLSSAAWQTFL